MLATLGEAMAWAFERIGMGPTDRCGQRACARDRRTPSSATRRDDVERLLMHALGISRAELRIRGERKLEPAEGRTFQSFLERYLGGEPLPYITGRETFWTLDLEVGPDVLIPRPETEVLVESALDLVDAADVRVLDLGTGCGAIALSLAVERPTWQVRAVDRSPAALRLAARNLARAAALHAMAPVTLEQSNWFSNVTERFDLIVANPPYVALDDPSYEGSGYEPNEALFSGPTGLEALEIIVGQSPRHLREGGYLMLEHGNRHGPRVREMMRNAALTEIETRRDFGGHERVTLGRRNGAGER
jgi:release factor glutamine methyltransferase